jgi:hypothetical protein
VNTVEKVHHSIADDSFYLLKKIPIVAGLAQPISTIHKEVLDRVYVSLKKGGKRVHKGIKLIPWAVESNKHQ